MEKVNNVIGAITANGQSIVLDVRELNTVLFALDGTYNLNVVFEGLPLNGTVWLPIQVARVDFNTVVTAHSTVNASVGYEASCHAFAYIRVRSTSYTSGTLNVGITGTARAVEPAPVVQASASQTIATPSGSAYSLTTAASTNAASVKSTAGNLFELTVSNPTATAAYVKLYNKASAPTVGTDVPVLTIPIPATAAGVGLQCLNFGQNGKRFTTGIAIAVTAAAAASDTAVTVAGIQIHGTYI